MDVGARIAQLRAAYGISQYALWKRSGIAQGALSQYESGQKTPGVDTLERICEGLGITMADFFAIEAGEGQQPTLLSPAEKELIGSYRALTPGRQRDVQAVLRCLGRQETE